MSKEERYAAEIRQGRDIADRNLERVWGWSSPAGRLRADERARFLVQAAGLGPGIRCLELGAGTGEFTRRLAASGCTLTAVELSEATAAICRSRVGTAAEVVVGDIETGGGLEGREFDAIVGVSVLHHVDLERCLAATFGLLREGGQFAFTEPNMLNPQVWAERRIRLVGRLRHTTPHETAFTTRSLRHALEGADLVVEVCEPFDFLHPATPAALIPAARAADRFLRRTPARAIAGSIRVSGYRPSARGANTAGTASASAANT